jgi:hypothetical protein
MKNFCFAVATFAIFSSSMASAQLAPPGKCTATQHRSLQDQVDSSCGAATKCLITDDRATLNSKIIKVNACISARTTINNTCFAGGDAGHKQAITERNNQLNTCKDYLSKVKP